MNEKNPAAVALGSIRTEKKARSSRENGKLGGRPSLYDKAHTRMEKMGFGSADMEFIFADWPEGNEHYYWLLKASKEEIADWIAAGR